MIDYGLIPISSRTLRPGLPLGTNIFCWPSEETSPRLLADADQTLPAATIEKLTANPNLRLYIDKANRDCYQSYLRENLAEWIEDDSLDGDFKVASVSEVVRDVLCESFSMQDPSTIVKSVVSVGEHLSKLVANVPITGSQLCNILHHDYGTFTHSANVGLYASMLAKKLGFDTNDTTEIGIGGLLHDLGKLEIAEQVLNKPAKLDDFEFRQIKQHPLLGFRKLALEPSVTRGQKLMTYQHHERLDGKGYPVGIDGNEIDDFAKICSVVDVYEALTSNRPYRSAMTSERALEIMIADEGKAFDKDFLRCWIGLIREDSNR